MAIVICLRNAGSMEGQDLIVEVARIFGFIRTGSQIQESVMGQLVELARSDVLWVDGDRVSLRDNRQ